MESIGAIAYANSGSSTYISRKFLFKSNNLFSQDVPSAFHDAMHRLINLILMCQVVQFWVGGRDKRGIRQECSSQVMVKMLSVKLESVGESFAQWHLRLPAQSRANPAKVSVVVTDVNQLSVRRKRAWNIFTTAVD